MTTTLTDPRPAQSAAPPPEIRPMWEHVALYVFVVAPFAALIVGIVLAARGHGITLLDVILASVFFAIAGHGVTIGFHRYLTHGGFKAKRWLRITLACAGSMSVEGPVIRWVADHRKHHAFADVDGDPHSPWRFGTSPRALAKGLWWAHTGWLFDREQTSKDRYAPDLVADRDIALIHKLFPLMTVFSLLAPAAVAYAIVGTGSAAWSAFLWAGLVRVFVLHHVTWSINSICHVIGSRPFVTRDKATNVWPLALISMGESWHNMHHADPTCARHGVDRGQIDSTAAIIRGLEFAGWVSDVRWPDEQRLARRRA